MVMELTKDGQNLTVKGENIEMIYWEKIKEGSGLISRCYGIVNGQRFKYDGYYKKIGRGRIKNEDQVWEMIEKADRFINDQGFQFSR